MDPAKFYNMITTFGNMAMAAGHDLTIAGVTFDKDGTVAA